MRLGKRKARDDDPHQQQTPYGGTVNGVPVEAAPHMMVCGLTGRGGR